MPSALLVCGSRSLARDPEATAWAKAEIKARMRATSPDLVMHGAAYGPDQWAGRCVDELADEGIRVSFIHEVHAHGLAVVWTRDPDEFGRYCRRHPWSDSLLLQGASPLVRNVYMVNAMAYLAALGCRVLVLGLVDATSPTRGTDHTLRHARAAGLTPLPREAQSRHGQSPRPQPARPVSRGRAG